MFFCKQVAGGSSVKKIIVLTLALAFLLGCAAEAAEGTGVTAGSSAAGEENE